MQTGSRRPWRLGMLVPSSNSVLEPETAKVIPQDGSVATYVSRLGVTRISADAQSDGQFAEAEFVAAARLLGDAAVDLILWNGTAASWLGFDWDARIVAAIERDVGIPATTAVMAINEDLASLKARRIGLVSPYVAEIESGIIANYAAIGIEVVAAARLDLTVNAAFGAVPPAEIADMVRSVSALKPDAVVIMCTNLAGASVAEDLGRDLGLPVIDSVRAAVLHACRRLQAMAPGGGEACLTGHV